MPSMSKMVSSLNANYPPISPVVVAGFRDPFGGPERAVSTPWTHCGACALAGLVVSTSGFRCTPCRFGAAITPGVKGSLKGRHAPMKGIKLPEADRVLAPGASRLQRRTGAIGARLIDVTRHPRLPQEVGIVANLDMP